MPRRTGLTRTLRKIGLSPPDADSVEASFRARILMFQAGSEAAKSQIDPAKNDDIASSIGHAIASSNGQAFVETVDTSTAAPIILPPNSADRRRRVSAKAIRLRDKEHCRYVTTQPCVICGRTPTEAHHLQFAQACALGRKVSDEYTVPVCRLHHRELHRYGDEQSWWAGVNVDPLPIALALWRQSRSNAVV